MLFVEAFLEALDLLESFTIVDVIEDFWADDRLFGHGLLGWIADSLGAAMRARGAIDRAAHGRTRDVLLNDWLGGWFGGGLYGWLCCWFGSGFVRSDFFGRLDVDCLFGGRLNGRAWRHGDFGWLFDSIPRVLRFLVRQNRYSSMLLK